MAVLSLGSCLVSERQCDVGHCGYLSRLAFLAEQSLHFARFNESPVAGDRPQCAAHAVVSHYLMLTVLSVICR